MKIQILSDLHLEHKAYNLKLHNNTDVLVLAGDICPPKIIGRLKNTLAAINRKLPVLYICGNHEYYDSQFDEVNKFWEDFEKVTPNFYFLNNKTKVIDGYQFVGSTLWSNFDLVRSSGLPLDIFKSRVQFAINDFLVIRNGARMFSPDDCINLNLAGRMFIKDSVSSYAGKSVVITHFCPHPLAIHEKYIGSKLNCYFTCNCEELIDDKIPLWIFGHTHDARDFTVKNTHFVCNPRGYPNEKSEYNSQLLMELP